MDHIVEGNLNHTNSAKSRTRSTYLLQMKPTNSEGSLEAKELPLQVLINDQDSQNEQCLISVLQAKQLQFFIDSQGQVSNGNAQYYEITASEPLINNEYPSSLQIFNNPNTLVSDKLKTPTECVNDAEPLPIDAPSKCSNDEDTNSNNKGSQVGQRTKVIQKFVHIADRAAPPRAEAVLPAALQLRRAAVSPRRTLPATARFGPVEGISRALSTAEAESLVLASTSSNLPVFLIKADDGAVTHMDVSDKDKSNWIGLLPLGDQNSANVWLYQEDNKLYAVTTKSIAARVPLALGYSKQYAGNHRLPVEQPVLDLDAELAGRRRWWCGACRRAEPSAALLQRHLDAHRQEEMQRSQRRHRCRHCARTFTRMFTLRRHMSRYCTKKAIAEETKTSRESMNSLLESSKAEEIPELSLNTTNPDDSRLPSDESLQTLTNNLDFSTSLFDTDRMPNLDISGSSRSETEFNLNVLGFKDDIVLGNSIDFPVDPEPCDSPNTVVSAGVEETAAPASVACRRCAQAVPRGRQRQHLRVCPGRKFQCECGRSFLYKDKLALHRHIDHANQDQSAIQQKKSAAKESEDLQYKCETCNHAFKRRGMLVNHLWRKHGDAGARVPLERRERVFPCGACHKLYRAADKRDRHVRAHHPDTGAAGAPALLGARRAVAPAACAACPRQYATRAKLLQHVRAAHPHLAPPITMKKSSKK